MKRNPQYSIMGRRKLVKMFSVTMGFVEYLERTGKIHPRDFYIGRQMYKAFSAKDVNTIRDKALSSGFKSCRERGKAMNLQLASRD